MTENITAKYNYVNVKGVAFTCKACPSLETVETVSKFTLCETLKGFMQGFAPHPTRDSASGLCQRGINPLETHFLFFSFHKLNTAYFLCGVTYYSISERSLSALTSLTQITKSSIAFSSSSTDGYDGAIRIFLSSGSFP